MTSQAERALPSLKVGVSLLYLSLYLHYGFVAFLPLWLSSRGMSPAAIGGLIAIPLILRILTVAPVAAFAGRTGRVRLIMLGCTLAAVALLTVLGLMTGLAAVIAVMLVFSFAWDQVPVLADAYAVMAVHAQKLDFGRLRVWGSIAVVVSSAAGGWVISQAHIAAAPFIMAGLLVLPAIVIVALPSDHRVAAAAHEDTNPAAGLLEQGSGGRTDWREILGNRPLMGGMLAVSLIVGSQGVFNSFSAIQWTHAGISTSMVGLLNATAVVSEIAFFWFGKQVLGDRDPRLMLAGAAFAAALRWILMATTPVLPVLIVAQLLQGAGATGAILGMMLLISQRTPLRLTPAAQGLNAVMLGAVLAVVTATSGLIWNWGPVVSYLAMTAVALAAIVPLVALRESRR